MRSWESARRQEVGLGSDFQDRMDREDGAGIAGFGEERLNPACGGPWHGTGKARSIRWYVHGIWFPPSMARLAVCGLVSAFLTGIHLFKTHHWTSVRAVEVMPWESVWTVRLRW